MSEIQFGNGWTKDVQVEVIRTIGSLLSTGKVSHEQVKLYIRAIYEGMEEAMEKLNKEA